MYVAKSRLGRTLSAVFPAALATFTGMSVMASQFADAAGFVQGLETLQNAAGTASAFSDVGYLALYAAAGIVQANAGLLAFAAAPLLFRYIYSHIVHANAALYVAASQAKTQQPPAPPEARP